MPAVVTVYNAQALTATRLCAAEACGQDAENDSRLCCRCEAKDSVRLHIAPIIDTSLTLRCCTCGAFKHDADFSRQTAPKAQHRRQRSAECKDCANTRRRLERIHPAYTPPKRRIRTPEQKARDVARGKQRRADKRALLAELRQGPA